MQTYRCERLVRRKKKRRLTPSLTKQCRYAAKNCRRRRAVATNPATVTLLADRSACFGLCSHRRAMARRCLAWRRTRAAVAPSFNRLGLSATCFPDSCRSAILDLLWSHMVCPGPGRAHRPRMGTAVINPNSRAAHVRRGGRSRRSDGGPRQPVARASRRRGS
jgi:hypothetical protein